MTKRSRILSAILSGIGMTALILDSKTAMYGAADSIDICIRTVIPSLLPFFVLSILLTNAVTGTKIPFLTPLGKLCGIPTGAESLLLIGFLGGYPVGAQSVSEAYRSGCLTKTDAHRMLGFCSNAGPAFIFGIAGSLFSSKKIAFLLWGIHILSALTVGVILPGRSSGQCCISNTKEVSLPHALTKAIRVMAGVCGWIIMFRILVAILDRWFLWLLPESVRLLLIGSLELANGCHSLLQSQAEAARFILSAVILGFGGICVCMQTVSVTGKLGTGWYFPGKVLQSVVSLILSVFAVQFLYEPIINGRMMIIFTSIAGILAFTILGIFKKTVAFWGKHVYNN